MPSAYLNISQQNHDWLAALSAATALPMARVADAILTKARQDGWQVTVSTAQVVQPQAPVTEAASGSPAAETPPRHGRGPVLFRD